MFCYTWNIQICYTCKSLWSCTSWTSALSNSTLHTRTDTRALTFHASPPLMSVLLIFLLLCQAHLSFILLSPIISVPVTSCSCCPTALLTNAGREWERRETGVDRGEDEADGSRGSMNSLSSWWLLWEGGWGYWWREGSFISQLTWFSLKSFNTLRDVVLLMCACV